jgi:hypothetical protein
MNERWTWSGEAFEWHDEVVANMEHEKLMNFSDYSLCLAKLARLHGSEITLKRQALEDFGLRCTVTLQLPDDERKVRLIHDIEAVCSVCGNDLDIVDEDDGFLRVNGCSRCLDYAFGDGYHRGKQDGRERRY